MLPNKSKGPAIEALFHIQNEEIIQIKLFLSQKRGLSWAIEGDCPSLYIKNAIADWVSDYLAGRTPITILPLRLSNLPSYTKNVLIRLQSIAFGSSLSYQELAILGGNPKAARAAGTICSRNPFPLVIPCHRILRQSEHLGGFSAGLEVKRRLLDFEEIHYR